MSKITGGKTILNENGEVVGFEVEVREVMTAAEVKEIYFPRRVPRPNNKTIE